MYYKYVPNKTISVPDDVLSIIDSLDVPFSTWVADQLRRYAASRPGWSLGQQLLADAALSGGHHADAPTEQQSRAVLERMERSAAW